MLSSQRLWPRSWSSCVAFMVYLDSLAKNVFAFTSRLEDVFYERLSKSTQIFEPSVRSCCRSKTDAEN